MQAIGAFKAKNKLAALLDLVAQGEEIVITRRGKPVAKMVRPGVRTDRAQAVAAAHRIMALRRDVTLGGEVTLQDLIDDVRR